MNSFIKISIFTGTVALTFGVFAFVPSVVDTIENAFAPDSAQAYVTGGGGTGCGGCGGGNTNDPVNDDDGDHTVDHDPQPKTPTVTAKCTVSPSTITVKPGESVSFKVTPSRPTNNGTRFESYLKYGNEAGKKLYSGDGGGNNYRSYDAGVNGSMLEKPGTYTFSMGFSRTGYNNYSCTAKIIVKEAPKPVAKCDAFSVSPSTLPYGGGNVKLTWNTTNSTDVSISGVGKVAADGSKTIGVNATKTFTLTAKGAGGNDTCTAKVTVKPATVATCDAFSVSPKTLPYGGGNVTMTWNTTNANWVSIDNGIGKVAADGSKTLKVTGTKTFTLTAQGADNKATCKTTVTVGSATAPVCNYLKASDTSVEEGDNVTLSWDTDNASSVSINNGVGSVSDSGSKTVKVYDDITYVLTAKNDGKEDTCTVHINVDEVHEETPRCDFFDISDDDVEEGDRVTLSWGTTNADRVYINNGVGYVSDDGSESVRVYDDTTFTLTVENGNKEDTCRVSVDVEEEDDEVTPKCELDISDSRVEYGDIVTLTWDTKHAEEITIEDDHGEEIFNSRKSKYFDGEIDVRVYEDTEFTLTVEGEDRDRDCDVDVKVDEEEITIYEKRDQTPVVAGISFTEVPYTGFEAGPTLTALFYSLLVLWALFIAYILVIKRGTVMGFRLREAGVEAYDQAVAADIELKKKVEELANRYSHQGW